MTRAEIRKEERRWRRGDLLAVIAALVLGAAVAWIVLSIQGLANELHTANDARDALARQVQSLGEKPVAGAPGSRGEPGQSIVGPSGAPGKQGEPGASGKPAPTITPRRGPSGVPGVAGAVGPTGPVGAQGEQGVPGPAGQDGQAGADGRDGVDGRDGQTCPDGYSLQAPSYDPDALVCRRDGAPDPSESPAQGAGLLALWAVTQRRYV